MEMPRYYYGTNRGVLLCHSIAMKFALHERGARCNLYEARTYADSTGARREGIVPGPLVLGPWGCSCNACSRASPRRRI